MAFNKMSNFISDGQEFKLSSNNLGPLRLVKTLQNNIEW